MNTLPDVLKNVLEKAEIIAIATCGEDGPHMVATWADYLRALDSGGTTLAAPAGGYRQTEKNLARNARVQVLVGSKGVEGKHGMGTGYRLSGTGSIQTSGEHAERARQKYPWARGALVIEVEEAEQLL